MSADLQRIIRIVFKGDNETQKAFNQLNTQLQAVETGVRSATRPMAELADSILKAQAAATTLATGGMALAVNEASKWETAFNEISTLVTDSGANMEEFNRQTRDYAFNSTASLEDIQGALYATISLGIDYKDALGAMGQAEKLATATNGSLKDSLRLTAQTMNAYGAESDEAARYTDVFVKAIQQGDLTIDSMAANLSKVTGIASSAGVPIEEVAAALATLTAQGEPAERASTALARAIQEILTPTPQAQKAFEALGIEFGKSALEGKGLDGVLMEIYEATGGNVEKISELFGSSVGLNGVLKLIATDGGKSMMESMEAMRGSAGATEGAFLKMADNLSQHVQTLINKMRILFIEGGIPILDEFKESVKTMGGVLEGLRIAADDDAFAPLLAMFEDMLKDVNAFGKGIADALPEALGKINWDKLREGYDSLGKTIKDLLKTLFQDLDPTKPDELAKILQTLADTLGTLATVSSGILKEWQPLMKFTGEFVVEMGKMDKATAESIGSMLGQAQRMEFLWKQFGFVKGSLIELALQSDMTAKDFIAAFQIMQGAAKILLNAIQAAVGGVALVLTEVLAFLVTGINKVTFGKLGWAVELENELNTIREDIIQGLIRDAGDASDGIDLIARGVINLGRDADSASPGVGKLSKSLEDIAGTDLDKFLKNLESVGIEIDKLPDEAVVHLYTEYEQFVKDMNAAGVEIDKIPEEHLVALFANADIPSIDKAASEIEDGIDKIGEPEVKVETLAEEGSIDSTGRKIQDGVKQIQADTPDIETALSLKELDTRQFEASMGVLDTYVSGQFDTIQTAIEWEAKLEIAEVEANAKKVEAIMNSLGEFWKSSGEALGSMFEALGGAKGYFESKPIIEFINRELNLRERAMTETEKMGQAERDLMYARIQRMNSGDPLITVSGDGLAPHLEMMMFEVLGAVQARASEEYQNFLLGVG